jgi:hypothetical protein
MRSDIDYLIVEGEIGIFSSRNPLQTTITKKGDIINKKKIVL